MSPWAQLLDSFYALLIEMRLSDQVPLVAVTVSAVALAAGYRVVCARRTRLLQLEPNVLSNTNVLDDADEPEIPDEYRDPITFSVIEDPVVLCGTGQVYDYKTIKEWFMHGNRLCPKTNVEVLDVQLTRLPWLKAKIRSWMARNNMCAPKEPNTIEEMRSSVGEQVAGWIQDIKSDTGYKRAAAVAELVRHLRKWEDSDAEGERAQQAARRLAVRRALVDDMVWMVRYGDTYLQGVAATLLACCEDESELLWLAAAAVFPLVALLHSHYFWTQEAAMQILYNIGLEVEAARKAIWVAGGVHALVSIIALDRSQVGYHRDRAAILVATLAESLPEAKAYLQQHGAEPLRKMLLHSDDRWEKRDAAFALLSLDLGDDQMGPGICRAMLEDYRWCSQKWLDGEVVEPQQGLELEEIRARLEYSAQEQLAQEAQQLQQQGGGDEQARQQEGAAPVAVPQEPARQQQVAGQQHDQHQLRAPQAGALQAANLVAAAAAAAAAAAVPAELPQQQAQAAAANWVQGQELLQLQLQLLGPAAEQHEAPAEAAAAQQPGRWQPAAAPLRGDGAAAQQDMGWRLLRRLQAGDAVVPAADGTAVVHARPAPAAGADDREDAVPALADMEQQQEATAKEDATQRQQHAGAAVLDSCSSPSLNSAPSAPGSSSDLDAADSSRQAVASDASSSSASSSSSSRS